MSATDSRSKPMALHPVHAVLLAGMLPLFLGALLNDMAYFVGQEVQWSNFASWLIVGGLVFCGPALLWIAVDLLRRSRRNHGLVRYGTVILGTFLCGFVNALVHARDAWAVMPGGLILSVVTAALSLVATWIGFSSYRMGAAS